MKQSVARHFELNSVRKKDHRLLFILFFLSLQQILFSQESWQSKLLEIDTISGKLTYYEDELTGIRLADFSNSGYMGGGIELPFIESRLEIGPIEGDNTAHIQKAIDSVSRMTINEDGFRGAVKLKAGSYDIYGSLIITTNGVVLRGAGNGQDPSTNTIIKARGNIEANRNVVNMGGLQSTRFSGSVAGSKVNIVSDLVKVGDKKFRVDNVGPFEIGDNIIVFHPCTEAWLQAIDYGATSTDHPWTVNSQPIIYNTRIKDIICDTIFTTSPVFNNLDRSLSQSYIYKYDRAGLVENVGIEQLRIDIEHDTLNPDDDDHARTCIKLTQVENAWVKDCTLLHFWFAGVDLATANNVTVSNVEALKPVGPTTGGYKYNFCASTASQNILFTNCLASEGRHAFVSNGTSRTAGIVFHNCTSIDSYTASEGHRRWSTGLLFDNFKDFGWNSKLVLGLYNRGRYGTGHGWSSANSVAWNCDIRRPGTDALMVIQRPPSAQNFAIACKGRVNHFGPFYHPPGYIEGSNQDVKILPKSLYEAQLFDRLRDTSSEFRSELLFFRALAYDNERVHLRWEIKCQSKTETHIVERSNDQVTWEEVETQNSRPSTNSIVDYTAVDEAPLEGESFYRLKIIDLAGNIFYSKVFKVKIYSNKIPIQIFPNPFFDRITIKAGPMDLEQGVLIYNSLGQKAQKLSSKQVGNSMEIDVSSLGAGFYFVKVNNSVHKIFKPSSNP